MTPKGLYSHQCIINFYTNPQTQQQAVVPNARLSDPRMQPRALSFECSFNAPLLPLLNALPKGCVYTRGAVRLVAMRIQKRDLIDAALALMPTYPRQLRASLLLRGRRPVLRPRGQKRATEDFRAGLPFGDVALHLLQFLLKPLPEDVDVVRSSIVYTPSE